MTTAHDEGDQLFLIAESLAKDFSLFSERGAKIQDHVEGLQSQAEVETTLARLRKLDIDQYIERCVAPAEATDRLGAKGLIAQLGAAPTSVEEDGAF